MGRHATSIRQVILDGVRLLGRAFETNLTEGVRFERRLFHAVFATADQKEGMGAFIDKRPPGFNHRCPTGRIGRVTWRER